MRLKMRRALALLVALAVLIPAAGAHGYGFLYVPSSDGVPRRWNLAALPDGRVPWFAAAASAAT